MNIAQRIIDELGNQGKNRNQLSKKTGISYTAVKSWGERGTCPTADKIPAIADFLGVSIQYLYTGEEPQPGGGINQSVVQSPHGSVRIGEHQEKTPMAEALPWDIQAVNNVLLSVPPQKRAEIVNSILNEQRDENK